MMSLKEVIYNSSLPTSAECLLAADIGGTNSNFGFFELRNGIPVLLVSVHAKSQEVVNFADLVAQVVSLVYARYRITVKHSCFAAAGVVSESRDYCKPTNLPYGISSKEILAKTSLHCVTVANDFEVIGYGLGAIDQRSLVTINLGNPRHKANRGIVGAGTGLGKCSLLWHQSVRRYLPLASEGGHGDCSAQNREEYELFDFIKTTEQWSCNVSWEDVLSGNGIKRMYQFYKSRNGAAHVSQELAQNGLHPDKIFNSRNLDDHARKTYELYRRLYARCIKNFALDALTLGGMYIAGGIAAHNVALFQDPAFLKEFLNCGKQKDLLAQIPIFVITDYNISLYGAVLYMLQEGICK